MGPRCDVDSDRVRVDHVREAEAVFHYGPKSKELHALRAAVGGGEAPAARGRKCGVGEERRQGATGGSGSLLGQEQQPQEVAVHAAARLGGRGQAGVSSTRRRQRARAELRRLRRRQPGAGLGSRHKLRALDGGAADRLRAAVVKGACRGALVRGRSVAV